MKTRSKPPVESTLSSTARRTWKKALEGETVIWKLPHNFILDWSTPLTEVDRILEVITSESSSKGVRIPFRIAGTKGSGKTTFLKVASLLGYRVLDYDVFFAAYAAKHFRIKTGSISDSFVATADENLEPLYNEAARAFAKIAAHCDFVSGNIEMHGPVVYLIPDYAKYRKFLYRRDHDPAIKRNHVGNEILSNFKFIEEINEHTKALVQTAIRPVYFDVFMHSYEFNQWQQLLARISDAKGLLRQSPRYKDIPGVSPSHNSTK